MTEFLILLLTFAVAWLIYKVLEARDRLAFIDLRMAELIRKLARLENEVHQLGRAGFKGAEPAAEPSEV